MNDRRLRKIAAAIDDARILVSEIEEAGGHTSRETQHLANAHDDLNNALLAIRHLEDCCHACGRAGTT